jgi:hypothetical protein
MAARVIHFGTDDCHRQSMLRRAGYEVESCRDLIQLQAALQSDGKADAVMIYDGDGRVPMDAFALARSASMAPIVLFPGPERSYEAEHFDLAVATFTPPEEWLLGLANLIVNHRTLRAYEQLMTERPDLWRS